MSERLPGSYRSVLLLIGLMVALLVVNAAIAYRHVRELHDDNLLVIHTHQVIETIDGILAHLINAETSQRGYVITAKDSYLVLYHGSLTRLDQYVQDLGGLTKDNREQQDRILELRTRLDSRLEQLTQSLHARDEDFAAAQALIATNRGKEAMDRVREQIKLMRDSEQKLLRERELASRDAYRRATSSGVISTLLGLLLFGVCVLLLQRNLSSREKASAEIFRERERLRVTLQSIGDAVISTDVEGRVRFMNHVAQELTGWTQGDAEGQPLAEIFRIFNEETLEAVENPALRALREGAIVGLANHTVLRAKDGAERPIDDSAAPIRQEDGTLDGAVLVFRDVTEHRYAAQQVIASEARKTAILQTALDCIITIDATGTIVEFNPAAEKTFGYQRDEVLGKEMAGLLVPPAYRELCRNGLTRHALTGEAPILNQRVEISALRAEGSEFPIELSVTRIPGDGSPFFTAYVRDITDRKQGEKMLQERIRLLALGADVGVAITAGRTLHEVLQRSAEALVKHLDGALARIWVHNEAARVLEMTASAGLQTTLDGPQARVPVGQLKVGRIAEERMPYFTNQVIGDERVLDQAWAIREQLVAFAGYPLIVDDRLMGVVGMFARHELSEHSLEVISSVANQLAVSIESKLTEELLTKAHADLEQRVAQRTLDLKSAHEFLHTVLENIEDGVVACDPQGRLTLFNRATREFHGLPSEPIPPEEWANHYDLFLPDGVTRMQLTDVPLYRALRGELVREVEMIIAPRQGRVRTLVASGQSLVDSNGLNLGAVVSMHDITESKLAERELQTFALQLQRSNRELDQFASVASHDLQEPLRKIQSFGDRLQSKYAELLGEQGREYVVRMRDAATRMRALVDGLLTFSRVTTKAQPFVPVDLGKVAREVIADLETRLQETGGEVRVGDLPSIAADPLQMRQLLQNLIANALKFQQPDLPPLVEVAGAFVRDTDAQGDEVDFFELRVRDNGIGFEEVYVDRIFEVFQRLHSHSVYEGTGIGLAICRKIAERHGGSITAHSQPNQGAEFLVRLRVWK